MNRNTDINAALKVIMYVRAQSLACCGEYNAMALCCNKQAGLRHCQYQYGDHTLNFPYILTDKV